MIAPKYMVFEGTALWTTFRKIVAPKKAAVIGTGYKLQIELRLRSFIFQKKKIINHHTKKTRNNFLSLYSRSGY